MDPRTRLEPLRLAAALVHQLPRAQLVLAGAGGRRVAVGRAPGDDLHPCQLRRAVLACGHPGGADLARHVAPLHLGGGVRDLGGGLFASCGADAPRRWFATLLAPARARRLLEGLDVEPAEAGVAAGLAADPLLGVTVVRLEGWAGAPDDGPDGMARRAVAACLVAELLAAAQPPRRLARPAGGGEGRDEPA